MVCDQAWGGLTAEAATNNWYNEYSNPGYNYANDGGSSGIPGNGNPNPGNPGTGHFTQVRVMQGRKNTAPPLCALFGGDLAAVSPVQPNLRDARTH